MENEGKNTNSALYIIISLVIVFLVLASLIFAYLGSVKTPLQRCETLVFGNKGLCFYNLALSTNNISLCSLTNQYNNSCYLYFANETHNYKICLYINDIGACYNARNISLCKNVYYFDHAISNKNISMCSLINTTINNTIAYAKNISLPVLLIRLNTTEPARDICIIDISNEQSKNYCYMINQSILNEACNYYMRNETLYTNGNLTNLCSTRVIPINICNELINITKITLARNVSACMQLNNTTFINTCLSNLANKEANESICSLITNNTYKFLCYMQFNQS